MPKHYAETTPSSTRALLKPKQAKVALRVAMPGSRRDDGLELATVLRQKAKNSSVILAPGAVIPAAVGVVHAAGSRSVGNAIGTHFIELAKGDMRKDADEIPMDYKDIDAVIHAQRDLVEVVHTLKQSKAEPQPCH